MVKLLVENGGPSIDLNLPSPSMAGTPLTATCLHENHDDDNPADHCAEILRYLIDHGADVHAHSGQLGYAINAAALVSGPAIVDLLLEKGAQVDVRDYIGRTPAHLAAYHSADVFQKIADAGGDIVARDVNRRTPLMWAAQSGRVEAAVKILDMKSNEDVNTKDRDGWTALCWAARGPNGWETDRPVSDLVSVIKLLLERGADKGVVATTADGRKWTPLKIARYHGGVAEVVELLKGENEEERPDDESKLAMRRENVCCDACLSDIFGVEYACKTCSWTSLCFKCYPYRDQLHTPAGHEFVEKGPEYAEVEEAAKEDAEENKEDDEGTSTDTSSDSDSDSESEEDEDADS